MAGRLSSFWTKRFPRCVRRLLHESLALDESGFRCMGNLQSAQSGTSGGRLPFARSPGRALRSKTQQPDTMMLCEANIDFHWAWIGWILVGFGALCAII